ncbi:MAG: tyrosine-type recombinase/integrase [Methylococcales bacterium]|nr:tyrosine-type recombinase/integrase [Methylococcales bacterium]
MSKLPQVIPSSEQLLSEGLSKAQAIRKTGSRPNTSRAFNSDIHYFWRWASISHQVIEGTLPIPGKIIECFVGDHLYGLNESVITALKELGFKPKLGRHKISTIKRRLSSLSKLHKANGYSHKHIYSPQILQTLRASAEASFASEVVAQKKPAITAEIYQAMIDVCDDSLSGVQNKALLSVGLWSGGRRRSELCQMQVEHLSLHKEAEAPFFSYTLMLPHTKSHYAIDGVPTLPIKGIAATHLKNWLSAANIEDGHIFRTIDPRSNKIRQKISGENIRRIIKNLSIASGFPDLKLSPHSLRSGFITCCAHAGIPIERGMAMSLHKTVSAYLSYSREGDALQNPAAELSRSLKIKLK